MDSDSEWNDSDGDYAVKKSHSRKRRKVSRKDSQSTKPSTRHQSHERTPASSALADFQDLALNVDGVEDDFESLIEPLWPELIEAAADAQVECIQYDETGHAVMPMSRLQAQLMADELVARAPESPALALLYRRLKIHPDEWRTTVLNMKQKPLPPHNSSVTPLAERHSAPINPETVDALYAIKTTPYENSFLSRICGFQPPPKPPLIAVDWNNRSPWMDLMRDIREHYSFMHPEREQPVEVEAPIEYTTLQPSHLDQVHDLLGRAFWTGIDVSDSLMYSPEKCTVIAMYKKVVVGVALISSPVETYINYLVVRAGWDNSQIATSMLYHLITLNPHRDITLHVSINNPAMLLYNRFGFKAEEFIVGFYEDYLDPQSRASKNAFRLRLRR